MLQPITILSSSVQQTQYCRYWNCHTTELHTVQSSSGVAQPRSSIHIRHSSYMSLSHGKYYWNEHSSMHISRSMAGTVIRQSISTTIPGTSYMMLGRPNGPTASLDGRILWPAHIVENSSSSFCTRKPHTKLPCYTEFPNVLFIYLV